MKEKIKIFKYFGLALIILTGTAIWYFANKLFSVDYLNNWSGVLIAVALFFVGWSLGAIIIRDKKLFLGATFISLITQLFFTKNIKSFLIIGISFLILWLARKYIRKEIKMRLKIDTWNYLRIGRRFIILTIALMLAGQYFFSINPQIKSENLPRLKLYSSQGSFVTRVVSFVQPDLIKENREAVTVDEFIIDKFNDDPLASKRFGSNVDFGNIDYNLREAILKEGRNDVAKMIGRDVQGDEKMVDIFLGIINNKIDDFLNVNVGYMNKDMPIAQLIFTVAIFLAIMGMGMIMSVFLIFLVAIVFRGLIFVGMLSIDKKAVNMEVIKIG
ncbi:MAG: hypothetical protein WC682_01265 [Parcubacteria group bacterium]|jgi:hypothetical protein